MILVNENIMAIYFGDCCQRRLLWRKSLPVVPLHHTCWGYWAPLGCRELRTWSDWEETAVDLHSLSEDCALLDLFRRRFQSMWYLPWRTILCFKWISGEIKDTGFWFHVNMGQFNKIQSNAHMHLNKLMRFVCLIWDSLHESVNKLVLNK